MKYILTIVSIVLLIGGTFLFKNFSKNLSPYEGVSGFEIDFTQPSLVDSYQISFQEDNYPKEIILYSWNGKEWQEESSIHNNNFSSVTLANFRDTTLSTRVLRLVFKTP